MTTFEVLDQNGNPIKTEKTGRKIDPRSFVTPDALRRLPRLMGAAIVLLMTPLNAIFLGANVITYGQFFNQLSIAESRPWVTLLGGACVTIAFTLMELMPQVRQHKNGAHYSRSMLLAQIIFGTEIFVMATYWLIREPIFSLGVWGALIRIIVVAGSAFGVSIQWDLGAHYLSKENK